MNVQDFCPGHTDCVCVVFTCADFGSRGLGFPFWGRGSTSRPQEESDDDDAKRARGEKEEISDL